MSETYRPLPDNLTIGKSKIEGVGLISVSDIESAVLLGITHVYFENDWIRTPLGGFINHSIDPNAVILTDGKKRYLYTIKPIKANEEIVIYYTLYKMNN